MTICPLDQKKLNIISALYEIHKAGWLTAAVLGMLLKPEIESSRKFGEKIVRALLSESLIFARELPNGKCAAYCLSKSGMNFLKKIKNAPLDEIEKQFSSITLYNHYRLDKEYNNKKSIDSAETKQLKKCKFPSRWKHHLISTEVLALLKKENPGSIVIFENQILQDHKGLSKIPDGILLKSDRVGFWLETEHKTKNGEELEHLVNTIIYPNNEKARAAFSEADRFEVVVAFDPDIIDNRGYKINHLPKIMKKIATIASTRVTFKVASLAMSKKSVLSLNLHTETYYPSKVDEVVKYLNKFDWKYDIDNSNSPSFVGIYHIDWGVEYEKVNDNLYRCQVGKLHPGFGINFDIDNPSDVEADSVEQIIRVIASQVLQQKLINKFN
jgi:hypothetical protein